MPARLFLDTNILLYAATDQEARKGTIARRLMVDNDFSVSTQVLNEFAANLLRKFKVDPVTTIRMVERISDADVIVSSPATCVDAIRLVGSYSISFWDALIVACARRGGCDILLSEDLGHGMTIEGVRIVNPFN